MTRCRRRLPVTRHFLGLRLPEPAQCSDVDLALEALPQQRSRNGLQVGEVLRRTDLNCAGPNHPGPWIGALQISLVLFSLEALRK